MAMMGVANFFILMLVIQSGRSDRWSRQLQNGAFTGGHSENDWIPLPDRQGGAKVLSFQPNQHKQSFATQTFHHGPGDNQNAPSQFNLIGEPFKFVTSNRYVLPQHQQPQAQPLIQSQTSAFPHFQALPQQNSGAPSFLDQSNDIGRKPFAEALVQDNSVFNQFQQNDLRASNLPSFIPQPQQSQISNQYQFQQTQPQQAQRQLPQPQQQQPQDEVQLVYVPLDTLNQQNYFKNGNNRYNLLSQQVNAAQINDFYTSAAPATTTTLRPIITTTTARPNIYQSTAAPAFASAKPKPHQPPLSMFLLSESADVSVNNVLSLLKNARNIAVLDSIDENETTPRVFIGPTGLEAPAGYIKFDLPYLSSIEQNRSERKLQNLPFFVAPLSYKTPSGFAKIPLPSPHVGSVVVNSPNSIANENNLLAGISQNKYFPNTQNTPFFPSTVRYSLTPSATPSPKAQPQTVRYDPFSSFASPKPKTYFSTTESNANQFNTNRGSAQTRTPETYRSTQSDRSNNGPRLSYNIAGSQFPSRQNVNEEYFNLDKKNKPVEQNAFKAYKEVTRIPSSTLGQSPASAYEEDDAEDEEQVSVSSPAPSTAQQSFNGRQSPYTFGSSTGSPAKEDIKYVSSSTPSYEKNVEISSARPYTPIEGNRFRFGENPEQNPRLVNFKLVDSVRPGAGPVDSFTFVTPRPTARVSARPSPTTTITTTTTTTTQKPRYESFERNNNNNNNENIRGNSNYNRNNIESVNIRNNAFPSAYSTLQPEIETYSPTPKSKYESVNRNTVNSFQNTFSTAQPKGESYSVTTAKPSFENFNRETSFQSRFPTFKPSSESRFNSVNADRQAEEVVVGTTQRSYLQSQSTQEAVQEEVTERQNSYVKIAQDPEIQTVAPEEESQYNLPSELPPISAHLPGLVNSLMEDKWMKKTPIPADEETTPAYTTTTTSRRPVSRGRRPLVTRTTTPASESGVEATTRRPVQRGRRPVATYSSRAPAAVTSSPGTVSVSSSGNADRANTVRNPNKVRHNPTPEERQRFRSRNRTTNLGKSATGKEEQNLEYQRDVLKQNYPVIRPLATTTSTESSISTSSDEEITSYRPRTSEQYRSSQYSDEPLSSPTTELPSSPSSLTPDEIIDEINSRNFLGLQEPMQIPQERQPLQKSNYQPAFNNLNENGARKLSSSRFENEIRQPVYEQRSTTPVATTTEAATAATPSENVRTRRPGFVRRPARPLFTTTQAPPQTTTEYENNNQERVVVNRNKPSGGVQRVVRIRSRVRRPLNATTTAAPVEDTTYISRRNSPRYDDAPAATTQSPVREIIRTRNREYNNNQNNNNNNNNNNNDDQPAQPKFRVRQRNRFQLDTQESQWAGQVALNSFHPYDPDLKGKAINDDYDSVEENEPEIITAPSEPADDHFLFNVSANLAPSVAPASTQDKSNDSDNVESQTNVSVVDATADTIVSSPSKASDAKSSSDDDQDEIMQNSEASFEDEMIESKKAGADDKKPLGIEKKGRRRGVWRKVRVHPVDAFETAESQNIGNQIINSLVNDVSKSEKKNFNEKKVEAVAAEEKSPVAATLAPAAIETTTINVPAEVPTTLAADVLPTIVSETTASKEEVVAITTVAPQAEEPKVEEAIAVSKDSEKTSVDESTEDYDIIFDTEAHTEVVPQEGEIEQPKQGLFDNVRKSLTDLFAMDAAEEEEYFKPMNNKAQYKTIERINSEHRALVDDVSSSAAPSEVTTPAAISTTSNGPSSTTASARTQTDSAMPVTDAIVPMGNILATSTSKQISHETEICYRGRCIKSKSGESNNKS